MHHPAIHDCHHQCSFSLFSPLLFMLSENIEQNLALTFDSICMTNCKCQDTAVYSLLIILLIICARTRDHEWEHRRFPENTGQHFYAVWLTQAAQRLWNLLLRELWKLPGHGPGHPAVDVPSWAGIWPEEHRYPCHPRLFCVILCLSLWILQGWVSFRAISGMILKKQSWNPAHLLISSYLILCRNNLASRIML